MSLIACRWSLRRRLATLVRAWDVSSAWLCWCGKLVGRGLNWLGMAGWAAPVLDGLPPWVATLAHCTVAHGSRLVRFMLRPDLLSHITLHSSQMRSGCMCAASRPTPLPHFPTHTSLCIRFPGGLQTRSRCMWATSRPTRAWTKFGTPSRALAGCVLSDF